MPYLVNGQPVPEEWIREEEQRLTRDLRFQTIADEAERARQLRVAAEHSAIDRMLVELGAASDRGLSIRRRSSRKSNGRNKPPTAAARSTKGRCGSRFERQFRLQRTCAEMMAGAPPAEPHKVEAFYQANRENFRNPGLFRAAHIVRHVGRGRSAEEARVVIEAALAELERGLPFAEVAERYSDCKGNGGEFGQIRVPNGNLLPAIRPAAARLRPLQ